MCADLPHEENNEGNNPARNDRGRQGSGDGGFSPLTRDTCFLSIPSIHNHKYLASFGDMAFCHCFAYDTVDMDI